MTSEDLASSFDDANVVTNPEYVHAQAHDFEPLMKFMESLDKYRNQLNYRNYDIRGILHGFSQFWQTAAIVSKNVFDTTGLESMKNIYVCTAPFIVDEWTQNKGIFRDANPNYWGTELGLGPYVEKVYWFESTTSDRSNSRINNGSTAARACRQFTG